MREMAQQRAGNDKGVVDAEVANSLHISRNAPNLGKQGIRGTTPRGFVSSAFLGFDRTKRIVTCLVKLVRSMGAQSQLEKEVDGPNNLFAVERLWPVYTKADPHVRSLCTMGFR